MSAQADGLLAALLEYAEEGDRGASRYPSETVLHFKNESGACDFDTYPWPCPVESAREYLNGGVG